MTQDSVLLANSVQIQATSTAQMLANDPVIEWLWGRAEELQQDYAAGLHPTKALAMFLDIVDRINNHVVPMVACRNGCSHCCYMAVAMTSLEAEIIGRALDIEVAKAGNDYDRDAAIKRYLGVACPFLLEGKCSIYDIRPYSCRSLINLSSTPEVCDLENHPGMDVPCLDMREFDMLFSRIVLPMADVVNDIRVFFPATESKVVV